MRGAEALRVLDWRRRVHEIYSDVRSASTPARGHDLWRRERDRLLGTHPASPIPIDDRGTAMRLPVAAYDPEWRFEAVVEPTEPAHLDVPTGTDGVVQLDRIGVVRLGLLGTLDVWWLGSYGGGVFVPVKDASAGLPEGTYGGGRYLLDTVKGADLGGRRGRLVLDFNFAYNPSCAYDDAWACPLAQAGNTLAVPVPVGERSWHGTPDRPGPRAVPAGGAQGDALRRLGRTIGEIWSAASRPPLLEQGGHPMLEEPEEGGHLGEARDTR